ncbi:phage integrase [Clostridium botulinum B str. Osaka05]|uniref:Phage integrase n=1 Tax=Clostridium botulinum B str. Osaka05 TaxID=1407017 RepID=A0A060N5C5_CLOBO|nr:tyrosine-type recombinase/integrase [Clostridium botulinum]BAO04735.1 phage integrase [Clostridium botulinum B str. Osaka05]
MHDKQFLLEQEYCIYLQDRICTKLIEAKEYELYCYFICSVYSHLRQREMLSLKWNQIDFKNKIIKNVKFLKEKDNKDVFLNDITIKALKEWQSIQNQTKDNKIFPDTSCSGFLNANKIRELTGIINLSGHMFRQMGLYLDNRLWEG